MPLTTHQQDLVKATVPILESHGETITSVFYTNLLRENPGLRNIFNAANQAHMAQPKALAHAVYAYAKYIDNPAVLGPTIDLVANKHASLLVQPEQYAVVGKYLLGAMREVLGEALTPELLDAWTAAYGQLADIFINKEKGLYAEAGEWTDWREFEIVRKIRESEEITSFWLKPRDGKALPTFKPGQYVSVQVDVPALGHAQVRQYSLSDGPLPDHYRISVKKESGINAQNSNAATSPGLVSNLLHDTKAEGDSIRLSHPMGDFFLDGLHAAEGWPVVLISGGVGLTGLTSILNSLVSRHSSRPISWVHAARTSDVRAFGADIKEISRTRENVRAVFFDAQPKSEHVMGKDYDHAGRLDLGVLDRDRELFLRDPKTEYYVCGPTGFMIEIERTLRSYGVEAARIHMELFGVGGAPRTG